MLVVTRVSVEVDSEEEEALLEVEVEVVSVGEAGDSVSELEPETGEPDVAPGVEAGEEVTSGLVSVDAAEEVIRGIVPVWVVVNVEVELNCMLERLLEGAEEEEDGETVIVIVICEEELEVGTLELPLIGGGMPASMLLKDEYPVPYEYPVP